MPSVKGVGEPCAGEPHARSRRGDAGNGAARHRASVLPNQPRDPRVMALAGALCSTLTGVVGFTHRSLRARVAALLGTAYSAAQMSYDLTRLRRKGLIQRLPGTNTYVLTTDGVRFALFSTKVHDRLLVPLLTADTHLPHRTCARRLGSSTARSPITSARPGCRLPEDLGETPKSQPPRSATPLPRRRSEPVAPDGAVRQSAANMSSHKPPALADPRVEDALWSCSGTRCLRPSAPGDGLAMLERQLGRDAL
jgi:hypothetical protein